MDNNESSQNEITNEETQKNIDKYQVKLETFEGPLDLLLHLIKTSEIDIYDIPIADITNQYLEYLSFLVVLDLDNITEFVEMASTLVLIKSKMMLPQEFEFEEDEDDPREELIAKLLEYQKYKIAAGVLENKLEDAVPLINSGTDAPLFKLEEGEDENWRQLTVLDLIGAFAQVLNKKEDGDYGREILMLNYSVDDKIKHINSLLLNNESFNYFEIINEKMPKLEVVCVFLALLELVKKGLIAVRQHLIFGDIHIVRKREITASEAMEV